MNNGLLERQLIAPYKGAFFGEDMSIGSAFSNLGCNLFIRKSDTVFFDVFTTLLKTYSAEDGPFFDEMCARSENLLLSSKISLGEFDNYKSLRMAAGCVSMAHVRQVSGEEILLSNIYKNVAEMLGCPRYVTELLLAYEIDMHFNSARADRASVKLYDLARAQGKRLVLIADTYLPSELVRKQLTKVGITGDYTLYTSSGHHVFKRDGTMFNLANSRSKIDNGCLIERDKGGLLMANSTLSSLNITVRHVG